MRGWIERINRFLEVPLGLGPRALRRARPSCCWSPSYLFPLWNLTMFAPQYPDGLRLDIYSYKLDGGNGGQDVKEINVLNHYIGMKDLVDGRLHRVQVDAVRRRRARPALPARRGARQDGHLVDVLVLFLYFGLFSLWSFGYKMYWYGHNLAPTAAVKVDAFMPPLFGYKKLANFEVYSYPGLGSYALGRGRPAARRRALRRRAPGACDAGGRLRPCCSSRSCCCGRERRTSTPSHPGRSRAGRPPP